MKIEHTICWYVAAIAILAGIALIAPLDRPIAYALLGGGVASWGHIAIDAICDAIADRPAK